MPRECSVQHASTLSRSLAPPSRTGLNVCSVYRDQQETNPHVGFQNATTAAFSTSQSMLYAASRFRHLGHAAVVVSLDHHTRQPGQGPRWRPAVATLAGARHSDSREVSACLRDERYHAPCPDCGNAASRARNTRRLVSSRRHPRSGVVRRVVLMRGPESIQLCLLTCLDGPGRARLVSSLSVSAVALGGSSPSTSSVQHV